MANKYYRENLRNGTNPTKRKSNIAKIMETFGPKKKDKKEKPKKRMFANKGGGADMGKMGEMKSKVTLAADRIRKLNDDMGISTGGLTKRQIERLKQIMKRKNPKEMIPLDKGSPFINAVQKIMKKNEPGNTRFSNTDIKLAENALKMKKGGRAALKKGSKFPDHSGDGKITQKDILMAKGVIPKTKSKKKII